MRTNYFLLLAILLGMIPMSYTHANDSIPKSVILYTPYTKISVSPGASIDYSIDLINNTDQLTNANLSVSGLSASWKHEMKSGGWSLSQLSVLPKEKKTFKSIIPENLRWRNWAIDNKDGEALTGDALLKLVNEELFPSLKNLDVNRETPRSQSIVKEVFEDINQYMKDGVLLRQVINIINEIEFDGL